VSLALCELVLARLEAVQAEGALAAWTAGWQQSEPRLLIGYREPKRAEDWPFVALVPAADERDLRRGEVERAAAALACGVRVSAQDDPERIGISAVCALADAVLRVIGEPFAYAVDGVTLHARRSLMVDAEFVHPGYQLELRVEWERFGATM